MLKPYRVQFENVFPVQCNHFHFVWVNIAHQPAGERGQRPAFANGSGYRVGNHAVLAPGYLSGHVLDRLCPNIYVNRTLRNRLFHLSFSCAGARPVTSAFNGAFLSGLDHLVLKMLYDPRVKPGMNEKTALPVLKAIAAEYERDGLFATADSDAAKNGLARLMP